MPTKKIPKTAAQIRRKNERDIKAAADKHKKEQIKRRNEVRKIMEIREKNRIRQEKHRIARNTIEIDTGPDLTQTPTKEHVENTLLSFEEKCKALCHKSCKCCRMTGLSIALNRKGFCSSCAKRADKNYYENQNSLPIWIDNEMETQYHVPDVLSCLTHAEKILIQRISPFVALTHIVNGTFGLTGHVCAFEQDIEGFAQVLPRTPKDATVIKVVRSMRSEVGGKECAVSRAYLVRKKEIIDALLWLKAHHADYREIHIDLSNLDWISGEEGILDGTEIEQGELKPFQEDNEDENSVESTDDECGEMSEPINLQDDLGPSISQTTMRVSGDTISQFGYIDEGGNAELSNEDSEINYILQTAVRKSPKAQDVSMVWPKNSMSPVDEYGCTRIFVNAFPWLFPGGVGDVKDYPSNEGK